MEIILYVIVGWIVLSMFLNKFNRVTGKQRENAIENIKEMLEAVTKPSWEDGDGDKHELDFENMTWEVFTHFDDTSLEKTYLISKESNQWFATLKSTYDQFKKVQDIKNCEINTIELKKSFADDGKDDEYFENHIEVLKSLIGKKQINNTELSHVFDQYYKKYLEMKPILESKLLEIQTKTL